MSRRTFFVAAVLLTLLLAGVASYYASDRPDGLSYVASETGFADNAKDSATSDSPLANYTTRGVDNARLSGALGGVVGVGLVALLGGALFWTLGRRPRAETATDGAVPEPDQADV